MKPSLLQTTLDTFIAADAEVPRREKFFADNKTRLAGLELTADLADAKALAEIVSGQAIAQLQPQRMEHARAALNTATKGLNEACAEFARTTIHPLYRALAARAAELVGKWIKAHYRDEDSLREAVGQSAIMLELAGIGERGKVSGNDDYRCRQCAERLLAAFEALNNFEKKHLS